MTLLSENPAAGKHLLFIDECLIMGGIATLFARVARLLLADGWQVSLVVRTVDADVRRALPAGLAVHELGPGFKALYFPEYAVYRARKLGLAKIDVIYATGVVSSWIGTLLSSFLPSRPALLCGAYTSWEYCYPTQRTFRNYADFLRCANFDRRIPDACKLFMSEWMRDLHARSFGRHITASSVSVLPIDASMFQRAVRCPDRCKIVSIGRISGFKTYNLYMVGVIRQLVDKGYPVQWHVYGSGELESRMRAQIAAMNLGAHVHLHGNLDYQQTPEVLARAGVFVGMGTALLEAGFCRVPSVVAVAGVETPLTYGYLYDVPFGTCGDVLSAAPHLSTLDLIERLLQMPELEYLQEMERTWQSVQGYEQGQVYAHLKQCLAGAQPATASYGSFLAYNVHGLYRKLVPTPAAPMSR